MSFPTLRIASLLVVALLNTPVLGGQSSLPLRGAGALLGQWSGTGEFPGGRAQFDLEWRPEFGGRFYRLSYRVSRTGDAGTTTLFAAEAWYRPESDGQFRGTWFDARGEVLQLDALEADSLLTVTWRSPSETGSTEYRLHADGTLESVDRVHTGDTWRTFATAIYRRTSGG